MIRFGRDILENLSDACGREWLETNGLGGFASSTVIGLNTRRYHGLLVAATEPPAGRTVLLSKLEETLVLDGHRHELGSNRYPGRVHPEGHQYLEEFRLNPFPVFVYDVEGFRLEKSLFMLHGENTTVIHYTLAPTVYAYGRALPGRIELEVRPLIAFRDYHANTRENEDLDPTVASEPGAATVAPYSGLPALDFNHDADELDSLGTWYRDFEYDAERDRGLDSHEDLFSPFTLRFDLRRRAEASIVVSTENGKSAGRAAEYRQAEIDRRRAVAASTPVEDEQVRTLVAAADQYLVARGQETTVIAGYHWFGDWGRDTMIALPGLTLLTRRADVARSILLAFAQHVDQGMLPNRFPERGEAPEYNTVDATLWYFEAVRSLIDQSTDPAKDLAFVRDRLYPTLVDILDWHLRGTRHGIRVDPDGLVRAGEPGVQLTWMDAKVGDQVVTPRHGKPVEIQALWYNALRITERLAREFADPEQEKRCRSMALEARESFRHRFWNEAAGCLYDVIDAPEGADGIDSEGRDASIRPNQIFAVSLAHPLLEGERARRVVETVERHLLTPYGLRSLAPEDPRYVGRYEGDPERRDGAYHQGTVWAWLIGPFIRASTRVHGRDATRKRAETWLAGLRTHLTDAGLGHISEIFDGDPPHRPAGCIAQAWSVAELLRTMVEDLNEIHPTEGRAADLAGLRSGPA